MRKLTNIESQFTAGGGMVEAMATGVFLTAFASIFIAASLNPKPYYIAQTTNCGWQPYLKEQRTPLYDAYGQYTGLDDVLTIEDYQWTCV